MFNLIPTLTALENVEFPLLFSSIPPRQRRQQAAGLLERVGLAERMQHLPTELSGGQQQRVAIARALVNSPQIILVDEPTGNLDSHSGAEVLELLHELNRQGITVVVVSHDPGVISAARQSIRLHDGQIVETQGDARRLMKTIKIILGLIPVIWVTGAASFLSAPGKTQPVIFASQVPTSKIKRHHRTPNQTSRQPQPAPGLLQPARPPHLQPSKSAA